MSNIARDIYKELGKKMPKKVYKKYCFCKCKGPNFGFGNDCGQDNIDMVFCPALIGGITAILALVSFMLFVIFGDFSYSIKVFIIPFIILIAEHFIIGFLRYIIRNIKKFNDCYSDYISHD